MEGSAERSDGLVDAPHHTPEESEGINLNIGCGQKIWKGFVNIDFPNNYSGLKPDIECDIRKIPLPDNHADSIYAIHVLEHFYRWETEDVLKEWIRILKPGGKLVIEVPCLDKVLKIMLSYFMNQKPMDERVTMFALYGDYKYKVPEMIHRWCFYTSELTGLLDDIGMRHVQALDPEYHVRARDMRVIGYK